jgi:hypothetical protein
MLLSPACRPANHHIRSTPTLSPPQPTASLPSAAASSLSTIDSLSPVVASVSSPSTATLLRLPPPPCCPAKRCSPSLYYDTNAAIHHYLIVYCRLPRRFLVTSCCSMHGTPTNSSTYTAFSAIPPSAQPAAFLSRMTLSERKGDDATRECAGILGPW